MADDPSLKNARPNPYKRNWLIEKLSQLPWWALVMGLVLLYLGAYFLEHEEYSIGFSQIRQGIWTTIWVSVVAYSIATIAGLIVALLRLSPNFFVRQFITGYVELVRGIPSLVLVLYVALALTPEVVKSINALGDFFIQEQISSSLGEELQSIRTRDVPMVWRAIGALAISYSAFMSEIFRAGIESIPKGQWEAGTSLGMSRRQVFILVVLPQAFRNILPPLANDFVALLKESSLVSVLGVEDVTREGTIYANSRFRVFEGYNLIAYTYLVITLSLSLLIKFLERNINQSRAADNEK